MKGIASNTKDPGSEIAYDDDLPDELKAQLREEDTVRPTSNGAVVMRLLGQHGELNRNELLIGFYRATGQVITRATLNYMIGRLKKKDVVETTSRGRYELTEKGQATYDRVVERLES